MNRKAWLVCTAFLLVAGCAQAQPGPASAPSEVPVTRKLDDRAAGLVKEARALGSPSVGVIVSVVGGRSDEAVRALQGLGAKVESVDAAVGYLRVTLPPEAVERAAALPSVSKIEVEGLIDRGEPGRS